MCLCLCVCKSESGVGSGGMDGCVCIPGCRLGVDMYRGQTVGGVRVGDPTFAPHLSQSLLTTKPG